VRRSVMKRNVVPATIVTLENDAECEALGAFLADRMYEFNANATGYFDGRLLAGCIRNDSGEVIAGFNGHTWGGCCELSYVWVHQRHRRQGLGRLLLRCAESEALARGCVRLMLASHDFQAPGFYERLGYERKYAVEGRPSGHVSIIYVKMLRGENGG